MVGKILKNNLHELVSSISTLGQVLAYPSFQFDSYPAAFVVGSGNESDYLTQQDNRRSYAFKVWLFQEFDSTPLADAYDILYDEADNIMNKIDMQESPDLDDSDIILNDGITSPYMLDSVSAALSRWVLDEEEKLLGIEVTVVFRVVVDISLLT